MHDPYVPVRHATKPDAYRIPVWLEGDVYKVTIGEDKFRFFTEETLPDCIKSTLGMVNAFPRNDCPIWSVNSINAYINNQDSKLNEIGWRVSSNLYMLTVGTEHLKELYGGYTREESKEESS
jgi:hypothetical protein